MDDPGFFPVRTAVEDRRFPLDLVDPADRDGYFRVLEERRPQLIYTTPSHQMPLGVPLDLAERLRLLRFAAERGAYIMEDDYDSIFRFGSLPIPTLKSLDSGGRVIYLGTVSKVLSPALRIGYAVLPESLRDRWRLAVERQRCTIPWLDQEVLRLFMERGCTCWWGCAMPWTGRSWWKAPGSRG